MKLVTRPMLSILSPAPSTSAARLCHAFRNCAAGSLGNSPVSRSTPRTPDVKNRLPVFTRSGATAFEAARPGKRYVDLIRQSARGLAVDHAECAIRRPPAAPTLRHLSAPTARHDP